MRITFVFRAEDVRRVVNLIITLLPGNDINKFRSKAVDLKTSHQTKMTKAEV